MRHEVEALLAALSEKGCDGAREQMPTVLESVRKPLEAAPTRRLLGELRSQRCFRAMRLFAQEAERAADGALLVYVRLQLAQAMIELGDLGAAIDLLLNLIEELPADSLSRNRSEAFGLLGRAHKQRFVDAVNGGSRGVKELQAAVDAYARGYAVGSDPGWHGANLIALSARAGRDGFLPLTDTAEVWAARVLAALDENERVRWTPWDYASAGEAYLALNDEKHIAEHFACYWNLLNADAFALAGTERQLTEIWEFTRDSPDPLRASLVLHLEARKLAAARGATRYSPTDLMTLASRLHTASGRAEATFGAGSAIPLDRLLRLLDRAKCICRISDVNNPRKAGTGFLVRGADLVPLRQGAVILTNHHVLHGDEAGDDLLTAPEYAGSTHVRWARAEFHYWEGKTTPQIFRIGEILDHSCRSNADFAVASLAAELQADAGLAVSTSLKPLGSRNIVDPRQRAKVFIIGHPDGGDLSFSFSDNEVVDHELDDEVRDRPRRIHYRTPTEPGSSGSPVIHHETLEVVGLHRTGRATPLRPDWPRERPDEVYEANEAVAMRSVLGL